MTTTLDPVETLRRVKELASGMSARDLEKAAMAFADLANYKRKPEESDGNRLFTFVHTVADCTDGWPFFFDPQYAERLPTNEEARRMKPEISVYIGAGQYRGATLVHIVHSHDCIGTPRAWVSFRNDGTIYSCSWNSAEKQWEADPD